MKFDNIYRHGFVRVAASAPRVSPGDPAANVAEILGLCEDAHQRRAGLVLFPELSVTGYAIDDLLMQDALIDAAEAEVARIVDASKKLAPVIVVGAPLKGGDALFNCAVIIHRGRVLGVAPKSFLPNYREYYEKRHFASAVDALAEEICVAGQIAPFGARLLFAANDVEGFRFHVEICEDFWSPTPPSTDGALAGALILCNLSASNVTIGKAREREVLVDSQSRRCVAAYLFAAAGTGESTTDLAWDGQLEIFEYGSRLASGGRFAEDSQIILADVDVERLSLERLRMATFRDAAARRAETLAKFRRVAFDFAPVLNEKIPLIRDVARYPYVPADKAHLDQDCYEAYNIQVAGLATRLRAAKIKKAVIGVSGGLDSTHALLIAADALGALGLPRKNLIAVTMPGFATSERTRKNALALAKGFGADARELDIRPAAAQMLKDIGHPAGAGEKVYDVAYENVQAGLRTDYLFRIANHEGGLVVGTGDLSELALGWCTYGVGDHMSHYGVNSSVAKTLIQHLIRWRIAKGGLAPALTDTLQSVLETEISPELVPAGPDGETQSTEKSIGPYALVDFALYYTTRYGLKPSKILFLAERAWSDAARGDWPPNLAPSEKRAYSRAEIAKWLRSFLFRFFAISQFKRSCLPNGPKISSGGALSPRGDWRAPSDGSAETFLSELDAALADADD